MAEALEKWEQMPREKRLLAEKPDPRASEAWKKTDSLYPEDGLVLRSISRDLKKARWPDWNLDFAWFRKEEARRFLPSKPKTDDTYAVPEKLIQRLARFHFTDTVRAILHHNGIRASRIRLREAPLRTPTLCGNHGTKS